MILRNARCNNNDYREKSLEGHLQREYIYYRNIITSKDSFYAELEQVFDHLPKYQMEILLGDFNAKVGRENIFKPTYRTGESPSG
jgi:hypothetical protein